MEETSPVAQWLRLSAAAAGTMGSIPAQGMKIPQAAWPMKENSFKDKQKCYGRVEGKLIMYSWAPHRRQNLSWDRMADWLKSGKKKKRRSGKVDHCRGLSRGLAQRGTSRRAFVLL